MAYNIIELNEKLTTELRVLAKEMGIRRPDAYKKEELIYKILDELIRSYSIFSYKSVVTNICKLFKSSHQVLNLGFGLNFFFKN